MSARFAGTILIGLVLGMAALWFIEPRTKGGTSLVLVVCFAAATLVVRLMKRSPKEG
jgi:uncharacterized membrane protein YccC